MDENTIDTTDRISMLPDSVVHHILSYLRDDPKSHVRFAYEKLLQQEGEGQTRIKFVLISDFVREQQFSGLNSSLKVLSLGRSSCPRSRIMKHANREISSSVGLRNVSVMAEEQKVRVTRDDLCLAFALGVSTPWGHRSLILGIAMLLRPSGPRMIRSDMRPVRYIRGHPFGTLWPIRTLVAPSDLNSLLGLE
ncbi:F-box domain containing protein [Tanacetum coccineum]